MAKNSGYTAGGNGMADGTALLGRVLMSVIFLMSGWGKFSAYAASAGYMAKHGLPGYLLPVALAVEIGGGLLIVLGFQTRIVAFLLAVYTLVTAYYFHREFGDRNQLAHFQKNLAMAGGFLFLMLDGPGRWSLDAKLRG
jgi:putative oxidoreductase